MKGVSNTLDMRPHAGADVEQQQHIHGHVFAGEVADLLDASLLAQHKVRSAKPGDGAIVAVHYLGVHTHQEDIALKNDWVVREAGEKQTPTRQHPSECVW